MKKAILILPMLAVSIAQAQQIVPAIDPSAVVGPMANIAPSAPIHLSENERHALALAREWKSNPDKPRRSAGGRVTYLYGATLPTVICAELQVCVIHLQAGEVVNNVHIGDTGRWEITGAQIGSGSSAITGVVVKPWERGLTTMMIITTNRRSYTIKLVSSKNESTTDVGFAYPDEQERTWANYRASQGRVEHAATLPTGENTASLDFGFSMGGDSPKWKPQRIYSDGVKTYIQFPSAHFADEAPVLVTIGKGGSLWSGPSTKLVNYRLVGDRYVVDQVIDRAALISGVGSEQVKVTIDYTGGKK